MNFPPLPFPFPGGPGQGGPGHGESDHACGACANGLDVKEFAELVSDNVPPPWLMLPPDERAAVVAETAEAFRDAVYRAAVGAGQIAPGDDVPRELLLRAINGWSRRGGKCPRMLLDALGVQESELAPDVLAAHDRMVAEFRQNINRQLPGVLDDGGVKEFEEMMRAAAPEGHVYWDGHLIPEAEHERIQENLAEANARGDYTAESPYRAELGANPFILLELHTVEGTDGLQRLDVRLGPGMRNPAKAIRVLQGAIDSITERANKRAANSGATAAADGATAGPAAGKGSEGGK